MVKFGPYAWSSYEGRESRCWLRDFVLVSDKGVTAGKEVRFTPDIRAIIGSVWSFFLSGQPKPKFSVYKVLNRNRLK